MITKISGVLAALADDTATLAVEPFEYEVLVPDFVRRQLQPQIGQRVVLHTIHYFDGDPSRGRVTPRLVGFGSPIEREFFELFCSVDGLGAKKALRAMVRPVQEVAELIEEQNAKGISALPGIGPATADRIIAKLRRKMPKFALLVMSETTARGDRADEGAAPDVVRETYEVLTQLGHSSVEARRLIDAALSKGQKFKDVETLINAVYQLSRAAS